MAWIELHQTLPRHPKLLRLAAKLRIHPAQAAGHLTFLWLWTLDYAPTGDLSAFGPAEISAAACFPGDAELFAAALRDCGWLDDGGAIHDWNDYGGKLLAARERMNGRGRDMRRAYENGAVDIVRERDGSNCRYCGIVVSWTDRKTSRGATYDHIDPGGPSEIGNLVVACRGCNSGKGRRKPTEAGMKLIPIKSASNAHQIASNAHQFTVQYSTVDNSTVPYPTTHPEGAREADLPADPAVELPPGFPRSEADAVTRAATTGAPVEFVKTLWHLATSRMGRDSRDVPIRGWPSYVVSSLAFDRSRKAERATKAKVGGGEHKEILEKIPIKQL